NQTFNAYGVDLGRRVLEGKHPAELKLEAARLIEMAVGDMGGTEQVTAVFEAYAPSQDLATHDRDLDPVRITIAKVFPTGSRLLDLELARLASVISCPNDALYAKLLARVSNDSPPVDDIHYLICAARLPVTPGKNEREIVARALVELDRKIARE